MKKYKLTILILFTASALLFSACKKSFLEITPRGRLVASLTSDYELMLNGADLVGTGATAQGFLGDEIAGFNPFFTASDVRTQRLFKWEADVQEREQVAPEMTTFLTWIYRYNKIINEVMDSKGGTEQEKKRIRAEALGNRAFINFFLINYYAKPYDNTTTATDPGFPIITATDVTETRFERGTVQAMYDHIISDLTTALDDLPLTVQHRLRMSRPGAQALLGKVYVFMGRFNDAIPLFNSCIASLGSAAVPINLYDYNREFSTTPTPGVFLPVNQFGPTFPINPDFREGIFIRQAGPGLGSFTNNALILSPAAASLYIPTDQRRRMFISNPYPTGAVYPMGMLRRFGPGTIQIGMMLPEIYLLRAECLARANNITDAVTDLELLRRNRMPLASAAVPATSQATSLALLNFIMEERIREFALLGYRWFDMRRLSVDPLFGQKTFTHTLYAPDGSVVETYTSTPERLVLRLPRLVLDQNPGMENNP
ncbi:MAG TPA: RagB/SusD family nutrient uptake outer membrane protein [Lacibacter sp.]|nr:RagB/SusD family nutrient uptake outer membrane protein [Lacibacter sp.]HMO87847.1 RagB/SusD family nutrient uptake outer membrane protein [Lacibacter sp.]